MAGPAVPQDGELQLGAVTLPAGRRIIPDGHDEPVAWVTRREVTDPGAVWSALSDLHPETGLVPILLDPGEDEEDFFFIDPCDVTELDHLDAGQLLAARWHGDPESDDGGKADQEWGWETRRVNEFLGLKQRGEGGNSLAEIVGAVLRTVTNPEINAELDRLSELDRRDAGVNLDERAEAERQEAAERVSANPFPGLAPPTDGSLSSAQRAAVLSAIPPARLGLVPARRSADALAVAGWCAFDDPAYGDGIRNALWIGIVLRSWETRFGARLLNVGPGAEIKLLVQRPPRTPETAMRIAAEHHAFCDECAGLGLRSVNEISAVL